MKKTIVIFIIISVLAKIIAYGRELVLSYYFGAGEISDVFLLSMTLPVTIFGFIATGVTSGYIPIYHIVEVEKGPSSALRFTNNVINALLFICLGILIVYFIIPKQLLGLFASGFSESTLNLARQFTNFSIWVMALTAIVTVLTGYLQINDRIRITSLVSVPLNIGVVSTIVIAAFSKNTYVLPVGFLISSILQVVFLWIVSAKNGFVYSTSLDINDKYLKKFISSLSMLILSGSMLQVNALVDRTLATRTIVGGLSLFEYGNRISDFIMGLTIVPISAVLFPMMVQVKDNHTKLWKTMMDGIRLSSFVIIPASVVSILFADVIVKILYFRGAFTLDDVTHTSEIVKFYGVGLLAFSLREMMLRCLYAIGDVKSPMVNSTIGVLFNIVLNFILLDIMGLCGLALATSISAVISVILLYRSLRKQVEEIKMGFILTKCTMLFSLAGVAGYGALFIYNELNCRMNDEIMPFVLSMSCFGTTYIIVTLFTGIISKSEIKSLIRR